MPMDGNLLLDTNIVIALFEQDRAVVRRLGVAPAVSVPAIVVGELFYGALRSRRVNDNLNRIEEFINVAAVISCDFDTAILYGEIKNQLASEGQLLPDNDLWIAAIALQHNLSLITRDAHFERIDNLKVEAW
jgi:tRNA(fMet)-specific endonuclease VapC